MWREAGQVSELVGFLAGPLSPWVALALAGVSFLSSFITASLGIGGGGLLLAVMASLVPPAALIPVHGVVQLGSNVFRMLLLIRQVWWGPVLSFGAGSIIGVALGGSVAVRLEPAFVQIGVGGFVLWSVFGSAPRWMGRWPWLTGGITSFLTMFFGATGLFVANFTKSLMLPRHRHVATHAAFMTAQHLLKTLAFGFLGFAFGPWLGPMLVLVAAGFLGTVAGKKMLDRMSDHGFRNALSAVLVLLSLRLIWQGVTGLR